MTTLASGVDRDAAIFAANAAHNRGLVDQLHETTRLANLGGP